MSKIPSRAIRLFGTEEPALPVRVLQAGPLSVELEAGNLRYIRLNGIEMIRAISFIARDPVWGTYQPLISDLVVNESLDFFRVTYSATAQDANQEFRYDAVIEGRANGSLRFEAQGQAVTDFATNRTGFVVLHPVEGVAGTTATIEDVDGRTVETRFPDLVEPFQPIMNLRAVTHFFAPGNTVTCRMTGDTYEMEDQRNWTDASYKTYVRPIGLPWPYTLAAGTEIEQSVTLTVTGTPAGVKTDAEPISVMVGQPVGAVPPIGIGIDPVDIEATMASIGPLRAVAPAFAVFRYDSGKGSDRSDLEKAAALARALGAEPWLQVVVRDINDFGTELAALGETIAAIGSPFPTVFVSPAPDLFGTLPGSPWPACPPLEDVFAAARKAFPDVRLGGGMFAYFTELNRKRPPLDSIDLVTFLTTAINHSSDDRSVAETLEALPYIARTAQSLCVGKPFVVGPSGIGVRDNPYNEERLVVSDNTRIATAFNDPRQRSLFGAAWNLGYVIRFAYGGAAAITLGGGVGAFGLVHAGQDWPQPFYDKVGGRYPVFHVVRGLAALRGANLLSVDVSDERNVLALAADRQQGGREIWLANLTDSAQRIRIDPAMQNARIAVLDADVFIDAAHDPNTLSRRLLPFADPTVQLDSFAVARIVGE